jgi:hypothetical protein
MKIIKEYCKEFNTCVIRTDSYAHNLEYILDLFSEASGDFPELESYMVEVVRYAGQRYSGTYGIEFYPNKMPPADYIEIPQLELL